MIRRTLNTNVPSFSSNIAYETKSKPSTGSDEPTFKRYKLPKSIDDNIKKSGTNPIYDYFYFDEEEHTWKASS